jgi:hypothetical protein
LTVLESPPSINHKPLTNQPTTTATATTIHHQLHMWLGRRIWLDRRSRMQFLKDNAIEVAPVVREKALHKRSSAPGELPGW